MRSSIAESGIASAAYTPLLPGSSLKASNITAVPDPSEPSMNPLTPPMRSHSSFFIEDWSSLAFCHFERDGR